MHAQMHDTGKDQGLHHLSSVRHESALIAKYHSLVLFHQMQQGCYVVDCQVDWMSEAVLCNRLFYVCGITAETD